MAKKLKASPLESRHANKLIDKIYTIERELKVLLERESKEK